MPSSHPDERRLLRTEPAAQYCGSTKSTLDKRRVRGQPLDMVVLVSQAQGNPATVLLTPVMPLGPGVYRVTLRGGSANALTSISGTTLPGDYSFTFTVDMP